MPDYRIASLHDAAMRRMYQRLLESAQQTLAICQDVVTDLKKQIVAISPVAGGIDQPGMRPARKGETVFCYWAKGSGFGGFIPMDQPAASKAFIQLVNEQHVSRPALRN